MYLSDSTRMKPRLSFYRDFDLSAHLPGYSMAVLLKKILNVLLSCPQFLWQVFYTFVIFIKKYIELSRESHRVFPLIF